jgi:hypothetical protein
MSPMEEFEPMIKYCYILSLFKFPSKPTCKFPCIWLKQFFWHVNPQKSCLIYWLLKHVPCFTLLWQVKCKDQTCNLPTLL